MFTTIRTLFAAATFPVRTLFRAYRALWWAFADSARSGPVRAPGQGNSFEVVDTTPKPTPTPERHLRKGFTLTLVFAAIAGLLSIVAGSSDALTPRHAATLWAWSSAAAWVLSYLKVRAWVRADPSTPPSWRELIRRAPGATYDAARKAGTACKAAATSDPARKAASNARAAGSWAWRSLSALAAKARPQPKSASSGA